MRSVTIKWMMLIASLLVAAIVVVQLYWLNKVYSYEQKQFNSNVVRSIRGLLEDIDLAILQSNLGVAENSALWITEDMMQERALPFIAQYLAVIIHKNDIVPTMHYAYDKIGNADYGFGAFIAGPSKTADIEQSLVLGAHGPKGMTIFILE